MLVGLALQHCKRPDAACIRDELFRTKNYEGASSTITFDEAGDVSYPLTTFRVQHGHFIEE